MAYFPIGHRDEVDDFNEYDRTPYGGGYDIALTYGRTLPPSYEICYPNSSASNFFDYNRPQYTSYGKPSAYANEALDNEYKSYARPKPRPGPPTSADGCGFDAPKPNYGFQPGGGVSEYGGRTEYGSGYVRKPPGPEFGSGDVRKAEYESPGSMHGSEYGSKPEYGGPGCGPGVYGRRPESGEFQPSYGSKPGSEFGATNYESGGHGYGGRTERNEYGEEKPSYPKPSYPNPSYPEPSYPKPSYPNTSYPEPSYHMPSYPKPSYPKPSYPEPSYPNPSYPEPSYPNPSYPEPSYPMPSYPEPSYERPSHYERKKYGDNNSDDEEKKRRHHHHRHH